MLSFILYKLYGNGEGPSNIKLLKKEMAMIPRGGYLKKVKFNYGGVYLLNSHSLRNKIAISVPKSKLFEDSFANGLIQLIINASERVNDILIFTGWAYAIDRIIPVKKPGVYRQLLNLLIESYAEYRISTELLTMPRIIVYSNGTVVNESDINSILSDPNGNISLQNIIPKTFVYIYYNGGIGDMSFMLLSLNVPWYLNLLDVNRITYSKKESIIIENKEAVRK